MEVGDDAAGQLCLHLHWVRLAALDLAPSLCQLSRREVGEQLVVTPHQLVGDRHQLAVHLRRGLGDADVVVEGLAHLLHAVQPHQDRQQERHLRGVAVGALNLAPRQQVELLLGGAQLDVRLQRHRVVGLQQGVEQLVQRDGLTCVQAAAEVLPLHHARQGVVRAEPHHVLTRELPQPLGVEAHLGALGVENLEDLLLVGLGVGQNFLARQRRAGGVAAGRVADHPGEIPDHEDGGVAQVLKMFELAQHHRVAQVDVGRGGVNSQLDAQRLAGFLRVGQLLPQLLFADDFGRAFAQVGQLLVQRHRL